MRKLLLASYLFIFFLLFQSCHKTNSFNSASIERLSGTDPLRALSVLNKIKDPLALDIRDYFLYSLYKVMNEDKCDFPIDKEESIEIARKFFKKEKDYSHYALSAFYCGRVFMEKKDYEKSMKYFLETDSVLESHSCNENNLKGLNDFYKGELFRIQDCMGKAEESYRASINDFSKSGDRKNENLAKLSLAYIFILDKEYNEALETYSQTLGYARQINDSLAISESLTRKGIIYKKIGDYKNAVDAIMEALQFDKDKTGSVLELLQLCDIYARLHQTDLAKQYLVYVEKYINYWDKPAKSKYYECLANIYESDNDNKNALKYYRMSEMIKEEETKSHKEKTILRIDKEYNIKKLQSRYRILLYIIIGLTLFIVFLILCNAHNIYRKNEFRNSYFTCRKRNDRIDKILKDRLKILIKCALINSDIKDEKDKIKCGKISRLVYLGKEVEILDWQELETILNELHGNKIRKLRENYPLLSEREIKIFMLEYAGADTSEISMIMKIDPNYLRRIKHDIRKKIGVKDGRKLKLILDTIQ